MALDTGCQWENVGAVCDTTAFLVARQGVDDADGVTGVGAGPQKTVFRKR